MADNVTIDNGSLADFDIAADEIAGIKWQYVKIADGTLDSTTKATVDANGLWVRATVATGQKIQLTDGTSDATVRNLAANDALNVAIVDASGNQITSFSGAGGTSAVDDADFTALTTVGTPVMGVRQDSPRTVTNDDMGIVKIDANGRLSVSLEASTVDTASGSADTGNPVKIGFKAYSALPAPVDANDRSDSASDLWGRQLTSHIDPAMQTWKSFNATTTQTSVAVWTPAAGKKIAITRLIISTYGTTAARLLLYFGEGAYVAGTSQLVTPMSSAPSSTVKPGMVDNPTVPIFCTTADMDLRVTTDAAMSFDISAYGYEW